MRRTYLALLTALGLLVLPGTGTETPAPNGSNVSVRTPVRIHLVDGSVYQLPDGFTAERSGVGGSVKGSGHRVETDGTGRASGAVSLALDRIFAIEPFDPNLDPISAVTRLPENARTAPFLARSSPTIYSNHGGSPRLEAEAFSTSLLRRIASDDLDRLTADERPDGAFGLLLSNEALETHYVDVLSLEFVDHANGATVLPTPSRTVFALDRVHEIAVARSRDGRTVQDLLRSADDRVYRTSREITDELASRMSFDWIEFEVPVPRGAKSIFLVLRARNTLFNGILLQDALLDRQGFDALGLLSGERLGLLEMWRLYRWCRKNLGLFVLVNDGTGLEAVERIGGTGPAAWRDFGIELPAGRRDRVTVRLTFLADSWMLDHVGFGFDATSIPRRASLRPSALRAVVSSRQSGAGLSAAGVSAADGAYLILRPGDACEAHFSVPPRASGRDRTYFVATRGHFVKWVRPEASWIDGRQTGKLDDEAVFRAARRWIRTKNALETTEPVMSVPAGVNE